MDFLRKALERGLSPANIISYLSLQAQKIHEIGRAHV